MRFEAMFYVKRRQKAMFIEDLVVFAGLSDKSMRRVFVDLAVLIAGEYLLSAEIWVAAVCV